MSLPNVTVPGSTPWRMRLDGGHGVSVPWGSQPPFVLACVMQHQRLGEGPSPEGANWSAGAPSMRISPLSPAY